MIPKIIHYCWLGGEKPEIVERYIEGWRKLCPEYKFFEWNEDNSISLIKGCKFASQAYEKRKWAFVSDYIRFVRLYEYGGIYLDTDVEMLNSFDKVLCSDLFLGYESVGVGSGIIGASAHNDLIDRIVKRYEKTDFIKEDGSLNLMVSPDYICYELDNLGFSRDNTKQQIGNIIVYPSDWFCPYNPSTLQTKITSNTITIHHYAASWLDEKGKYRVRVQKKLLRFLGTRLSYKVSMVAMSLKFYGLKKTFSKILKIN